MLARQSNRRVVEELDRMRSLSAVANARAEEREHFASRPVGEREEQTHVISVEEGHPPILTV